MSSAGKVSVVDRCVWLLLRSVMIVVQSLPLGLVCRLGQTLGALLYLLGAPFKRIALINLKFAYGEELDAPARRRILWQNLQHFGIGGLEWIRMLRMNETRRRQVCEAVEVEGLEHLERARQQKGKVILLSGHYGHWEYATVKYASEINPLSFIVRPIDNPLVERERRSYHDPCGARILYKENGLREALRGLNKGEDLLLLADRKAGFKEGIPANFFGQKTSTLTIAVSLARKYNAALVPTFIVRERKLGRHKLIFLPRLEVENCSLEEGVQMQNDCIEKMIRKYPEMWLWVHRKWKCYHREIYKR